MADIYTDMYNPVASYIRCIVVILLLLQAAKGNAQNSVWTSAKSAKKDAAGRAVKTTQRARKFKDHLQQWGLDTNYNHAFLIGGKLNSDGWSGSMYFVKRKSYNQSRVLQISFSEIKHEKETKQKGKTSPGLGNATPYVFGKVNNLYTLQVGIGKEKLLLPAVLDGNLSVSMRYSVGVSLAMLKPYYLKLIYVDNNGTNDTTHSEQHRYSRADSARFLNPNTILGASTFSRSLPEIDYVPGVFFETAIAITPGKNKSFIQVITLGINAAYYTKALPIMADQKAYPWQASLFAGIGIGKRWR